MKVLERRQRIDAADGLAIAVVFDEPASVLAGMLRELELPYPVLVDRERTAYRAWGLRRAARRALITRPGWIRGYLEALLGRGESLARPGSDVLQLGGDFVVGRHGRLVLAHPQRHFDDRPPAGALVRALEESS